MYLFYIEIKPLKYLYFRKIEFNFGYTYQYTFTDEDFADAEPINP